MTSPYSKPPFPRLLWVRFLKLALKYGFKKRGSKWLFMERMIDKAEKEPWDYKPIEE